MKPATEEETPETATPNPFMRAWGSCFAALYNPLLWRTERRGNAKRRANLIAGANGTVVELGAGTGHNLSHYPDDAELILTEPHEPMARRLEQHVARSGREATVLRAPAEDLPLPDNCADTVVSTLVLCTVGDLDASLAEARRVLKPGGRLLFLEHVAAEPGSRLDRWQRKAHGFWHGFACGCHTNRETEAAIRRSGLRIDELVNDRLEFEVPLIHPLIWGRAINP
ncbi:MAG: class I SAM-dependent methyltransferase [Solirubrobacterales bacterium]|nr:class I SAM-dependent methyltransferase [Solirubrobacterales bacterium]